MKNYYHSSNNTRRCSQYFGAADQTLVNASFADVVEEDSLRRLSVQREQEETLNASEFLAPPMRRFSKTSAFYEVDSKLKSGVRGTTPARSITDLAGDELNLLEQMEELVMNAGSDQECPIGRDLSFDARSGKFPKIDVTTSLHRTFSKILFRQVLIQQNSSLQFLLSDSIYLGPKDTIILFFPTLNLILVSEKIRENFIRLLFS